MTKKLMMLIVLAISVLSIIVIAVWGTLPESINQPQVTSISFLHYELTTDNSKIINIYGVVTEEDPYYTLSYTYEPDDAYADLIATSSSDAVTVFLDVISHEIFVTFSEDAFKPNSKNVTIRLTDHKTNKYDEITLIFRTPDIIIED